MKFTIDIECTPEEARTFLGLPDVKGLQDNLMKEYEAKFREAMNTMNPEQALSSMMKGFSDQMPGSISNTTGGDLADLQDMQKAFWSNMVSMAGQAKTDDKE